MAKKAAPSKKKRQKTVRRASINKSVVKER